MIKLNDKDWVIQIDHWYYLDRLELYHTHCIDTERPTSIQGFVANHPYEGMYYTCNTCKEHAPSAIIKTFKFIIAGSKVQIS